jgi:hypothetical protein
MNAIFIKEIKYTDKDGDAIGDREIKVTVTVDSDFDWKNEYRDQDGEFDFSTENQEKGLVLSITTILILYTNFYG